MRGLEQTGRQVSHNVIVGAFFLFALIGVVPVLAFIQGWLPISLYLVGVVGLLIVEGAYQKNKEQEPQKREVTDELTRLRQQLETIRSSDRTMLKGDVTIRNIAAPDEPHQTSYIQFTTEGERSRFFLTEHAPRVLRFVTLGGHIVRETDIPKDIPCGLGKLVVTQFTSTGFVLAEQNTIGDRVRVVVYFESNISSS